MSPMMGIIDEPQDRLQRIGNIKMGFKGAPRPKSGGEGTFRLPQKLDHFIVTTMERDPQTDDWLPDNELMTILGEKPTSIPVMVPFDNIMDIIPHEFAWWKSSRRMCHGNGLVGLRYNEGTNTDDQMECRCENFTGAGGVTRVCKKNGILNVIITESGRIGGVYQLRTTSGTTISNIKASINLIKSFTGGPVAGIPLMLTIQKQWAYPIVKGVKKKVEIYVAGLEFRANMGLDASPAEQLLERAGVQIQARLSVGKDVLQIEQFSSRRINTDTEGDVEDWEHEFGPGAGSDTVDGEIEGKTQGKTSDLRKRLAKSKISDAETVDKEPAKNEPTLAEINETLQTEIRTLLENELLSETIIEKTTAWLSGNRRIKSLEDTRDKLIKTIDDAEQKKQSKGEGESEEELRKVIRADIIKLMDTDILPKAVVGKINKWLEDQARSSQNLEAGKATLIATIKKYEQQAAMDMPEKSSGDDGGAEEKSSKPSIAELGGRVIDLLGKAREEGLASEVEHAAVFDEADRLGTAKELEDLYEKWESEIDDRRLIRDEEQKQAKAK